MPAAAAVLLHWDICSTVRPIANSLRDSWPVMEALRAAHIEMWNRNFVVRLGGYVHKVGDAIDT